MKKLKKFEKILEIITKRLRKLCAHLIEAVLRVCSFVSELVTCLETGTYLCQTNIRKSILFFILIKMQSTELEV